MLRYALIVISISCLVNRIQAQKAFVLTSPGKNVRTEISLVNGLSYSITVDSVRLMDRNTLDLQVEGMKSASPMLRRKLTSTVNEVLRPVVSLENAAVNNHYNQLRLEFRNGISVEFRAYDDGIAYRFMADLDDSINITGEDAGFHFSPQTVATWSPVSNFKTDYQTIYTNQKLTGLNTVGMSVLPVLMNTSGYKVLISEADLHDYPCMFLQQSDAGSITALFPKVPTEFAADGDRSVKIVREAAYIARTNGRRSFPWRFFHITHKDEDLIGHNFVSRLSGDASGSALSATSQHSATSDHFNWVRPGQVMWEWWHDARVYGVDFKSGYNQDTYRYYIDFAASHGIPYILMDEGWAAATMDPFTPNPEINLKELIAYGRQKDVKILLWFTWLAVERNFSVFKTLHNWGIAGMKIDFMDRSDQWMVNYYERVAKEAAANELLIDFHGAFKPAGLEQKWPNVLSYEGVVGMEANIFYGVATPDNNVFLPFLRNAVGPMDYTPGAMYSVHRKDFFGNRTNTMSIGTRAHQLAMYVVFESGLQMLADNPYHYLREPEATAFITSVPCTWDSTMALQASAGEYLVVARRKGEKWFIGGMTNYVQRDLHISTSFLEPGRDYDLVMIQDGINADVQAMDYKLIRKKVKQGEMIDVHMASEGGYAATFEITKDNASK